MLREIKFRGKRIDTKEWVYGYYNFNPFFNRAEIFSCDDIRMFVYAVIPETVGQFTGLRDANGKEIYEDDIVDFIDLPAGEEALCTGEVIFEEFGWHFTNSITESSLSCYDSEYLNVIGNKHDNSSITEAT